LARTAAPWWFFWTVSFRPLFLVPALLLVPAVSLAGPPAKKRAAAHLTTARLTTARLNAAPQRSHEGVSVGSPTEGHLLGGAHVVATPYLRLSPAYDAGDPHWGLEALVGLIDRSARAVHKQFPDAMLTVGHLSKPGGGEIDRHASHESGRDADLQFYIKNAQGKPIYADHFVAFLGDGTAPTWPGAHFDDARNWALVSSIVGDGHAHVTHVFVATPIRARLLAYAEKTGASGAIRSRAAELMAQPHGSLPHDDHFHVRIACPSGMDKCIELPVRHHATLASHATPAHATPKASASSAHVAAPAHPVASAAAPPKATPKGEPERNEPSMPSLAPIVPGLDSAVIPAPLDAANDPHAGDKPAAPGPKPAPIDDPDGVLDDHAK
jgi:penicillin-insensitive murein endopeptidase